MNQPVRASFRETFQRYSGIGFVWGELTGSCAPCEPSMPELVGSPQAGLQGRAVKPDRQLPTFIATISLGFIADLARNQPATPSGSVGDTPRATVLPSASTTQIEISFSETSQAGTVVHDRSASRRFLGEANIPDLVRHRRATAAITPCMVSADRVQILPSCSLH